MIDNIEIIRLSSLDNKNNKDVIKLITKVFGITDLPEINYHYELVINGVLIGYSAISKRKIVIDDNEMQINLLGLFCITENSRKIGLGGKLLQYIKKDIYTLNDYGIILNCGVNIEQFYISNGFIKISNHAKYNRNNIIQIDTDPVLYYGNKLWKHDYESVYLGSDF